MITDKEIEAAVLFVIEKREFPEGRPHGLVDFTPHQEVVSFGIECAQWLRSELLKRSEQSFNEHIASLDTWEIPVSAERAWQAATLAQAATVEQLREELAKKDGRIKELELRIPVQATFDSKDAENIVIAASQYITRLEDALIDQVTFAGRGDLIYSIKQKREKT